GIGLTSAYSLRTGSIWYLRGAIQQEQLSTEKEWPALAVRWLWSPHGGFVHKAVNSISANAGYNIRTQSTETPSLGSTTEVGLSNSQRTRGRPLSISISWG